MKVVVALDFKKAEENIELGKRLGDLPEPYHNRVGLKIGLRTFYSGGPGMVAWAKGSPFEICVDLKLPDIPDTMAGTAQLMAEAKVDLFTIHANNGFEALNAVHQAIRTFDPKPKMLAVTILTSMKEATCQRIYGKSIREKVKDFTEEALRGNADGIVCSPHELPLIDGWIAQIMERQGPPPKLIKFIPSIELAPRNDDQHRKGGLADVVRGGADYIVIGRPIRESDNPLVTLQRVIDRIDRLQDLLSEFDKQAIWT